MARTIDTERILDRCCQCGARAAWDEVDGGKHAVSCTECANGIAAMASIFEASRCWNIIQRFGKKGGLV